MVLRALGQIGPAARAALTDVRLALRDSNGSVRTAAAEALWRIEGKGKRAFAILAALVTSHNQVQVNEAAAILARIGPAAGVVKPVLARALKAETTHFGRVALAEALWRVSGEPQDAVAELTAVLQDQDPMNNFRPAALNVLGRMGPAARAALPAVKAALYDDNANLALQAIDALKKIDPKGSAKLFGG
jgi:HEAT repeat protein